MAPPHFSQFYNIHGRKNRLAFQAEHVDLAYLNAIRRVLLAEIPNVGIAFDPLTDANPDMHIEINTSSLHNEYLAHRVSLLPLCFSEEEVANFDPAKYTFRLRKHNRGAEILVVTSADVEIFDENDQKYPPEFHRRIFPTHPITHDHLLITKLKPNVYNKDKGEQIDMTFKASIGIAKQHSRWCPVSTVVLNNIVDDAAAEEGFQEKVDATEKDLGQALSPAEKEALRGRFNALDRYRFFKKNVYDEPNAFNFAIRSICALRPEYLFQKALEVLKDKVAAFITHVQEAKPEAGVTVRSVGDVANFYEMDIHGEDHTLLNVLQSILYNKCIRDKKLAEPKLTYIGYHDPHPLDPRMVLKVKFADAEDAPVTEKELRDFFVAGGNLILEDLAALEAAWQAAVSKR